MENGVLVRQCDDAHGPAVPARRGWPDDVSAWIVLESFEPGVTVQEVARHHGLLPQCLSTWRRRMREGLLPDRRSGGGSQELVPVVIGDGPGGGVPGEVTIEALGVVVRLPAYSPVERIVEIACSLKVQP